MYAYYIHIYKEVYTQNHTVREFTLMHINLWTLIAEATCMTEDSYTVMSLLINTVHIYSF